ncbi:MAG: ribbon-helix-helix domain-containing protein [Tannerellaceae bacterium]|nr:ribbon-helix-helix domain-containing protein [Tannerellaceae bacterium]
MEKSGPEAARIPPFSLIEILIVMDKDKVITFRLDYSLLSDMQRIAEKKQVSVSRLIRTALQKFTEEYESQEETIDGDHETPSNPYQ